MIGPLIQSAHISDSPSEFHLSRLPKLLYLSDVPVEASWHGSLLIHRLLEDYPTDRLRVVEGSVYESLPSRRLPGVLYTTFPFASRRIFRSRFRDWYSTWVSIRSS